MRESWGLRGVLVAAASRSWRYKPGASRPWDSRGSSTTTTTTTQPDTPWSGMNGPAESRREGTFGCWCRSGKEKGTRVRSPSSVAQLGTGANVLNVCYRLRMEGRQGGRPGVDVIPVGCQKVPPCRCTYEYCSRQARRWVVDSAPKPRSRRGFSGIVQQSR